MKPADGRSDIDGDGKPAEYVATDADSTARLLSAWDA